MNREEWAKTHEYVQVSVRYYNHGVIEYVFERENNDYKWGGVTHGKRFNHFNVISRSKDNKTYHNLEIQFGGDEYAFMHFKKYVFFKFDKDYVSIYTVPSSLQRGLYEIRDRDEKLTDEEKGLHLDPGYGPFMAVCKKISRKGRLHLKRIRYITCSSHKTNIRG